MTLSLFLAWTSGFVVALGFAEIVTGGGHGWWAFLSVGVLQAFFAVVKARAALAQPAPEKEKKG